MTKPKIAKLVTYLRDLYEAGLRYVKYDALRQDINIPDYLARFWLRELEKQGYVKIQWGLVILRDTLARGRRKIEIKERAPVRCPSCGEVIPHGEKECPTCKNAFLEEGEAKRLIENIAKAQIV